MNFKTTLFNSGFIPFFIIVNLLLSACGRHAYYMPKEANLLQLKERNDFKVALSTKVLGAPFSRINAQAAFSPLKYVGVKLGYFDWKYDFEKFKVEQFSHSKNKSFAIGGYYFFKQKKPKYKNRYKKHLASKQGLLIDLYGGMAEGNYLFKSITRAFDYQFKYKNYFVQSGIYFQGERFGVGVNYQNVVLDIIGGQINHQTDFESSNIIYGLLDDNINPMNEFAFNLSWGIKYIKTYGSISFIANDLDRVSSERVTTLRMGLVANLDDIYDECYQNFRFLRKWKSNRKRKQKVRKRKRAKKQRKKERRKSKNS